MSLTVYRRITQVAFILLVFLLPVLDIFRYDAASRELILFGQVWGLGLKDAFYAEQGLTASSHVALQIFLRAILPWLFALALFPLLGFLTGRLFCGWLCPEGALFELSDWLTVKIIGRRSLYRSRPNDPEPGPVNRVVYPVLALLCAAVIPVAGGMALTGYFVAPRTILHQVMTGDLTFGVKAGIIGVSIYMLTTSILVRHALCRYVCAAGLMQMLFGWASPVSLRVGMDTSRVDECTNCRGCDRACFMNVTPRRNRRDISCVNCGACIEACHRELNGRGLFHFSSDGGIIRPAGEAGAKPACSRLTGPAGDTGLTGH